jgi:hypothetical protein
VAKTRAKVQPEERDDQTIIEDRHEQLQHEEPEPAQEVAEEPRYTQFAQQAVSLADLFDEKFKKPLAGRPANFRIKLAVPDGPSTAGGKQGTQHIKLVPLGKGPILVAGWANQAQGEAEIRSWEHLKAIHDSRKARAGLPEEPAYRKLVLDMKRFFENEQLTVTVVAAPRTATGEEPVVDSGDSSIALILGIFAGLAIAAIAIFLLVR